MCKVANDINATATNGVFTEKDRQELREIIEKHFSHRLTPEEITKQIEWLLSRPGAYTTFSKYINNQLVSVGVKCRYDEKHTARFYLVTEFGEEWDDED